VSRAPLVTLSPRDFDAVLFDLDGVLTRTAAVHAAAWQKLFDDFLQQRSASTGERFVAFDKTSDYLRYVDGRPRHQGVATFLESRGIDLPQGSPDDGPDVHSVYGLGNLKDRYFNQYLQQRGVAPYGASIELVRTLRAQGVKTAVVSSSNNCAAVLEAVGISHLFDTRVDGLDVSRLGLPGKPAPDAFLEGARRLGIDPARAVVIEDAIAGVQAGRAGHFGFVIGVDRVGQARVLREAGADAVVTSLEQVQVAVESPSAWSLRYDDFDTAREGMREALCALGNGYFGTRGAAATADADQVHYPGVYLAGGYNRLLTQVGQREVENEDLVNLPNWLSLKFHLAEDSWFDERNVDIRCYRQELNLHRGVLVKSMSFEDARGRRTTLVERRLVSMAQMHVAALEWTLTADNWSGDITFRSGIEGRIVNAGAQLYRRFNNRHLEVIAAGELEHADGVFLQVRTSQSRLEVAQAARTRVFRNDAPVEPARQPIDDAGYIGQEFTVRMEPDETIRLEKIVSLHTSRDEAIAESALAAHKTLARAPRFERIMERHVFAWRHLWRRFDIHIRLADTRPHLNMPMLLRLNMFHLLQAASLNSIGLDIGVPARGWTGEAYQGHIFWDELFIFPTLNFRSPEITRSLLMYRYRRLDEARAAATAAGFKGAMYPWQSASDGQEETQELNLNPRSQRWVPDNSWLQRHVGSAVAWNVWQYFQITNDTGFLEAYGAEMILEIARFWASIATFDEHKQRYEICGVMGPDEYHEGYPDSPTPGLNNNAYTNLMAVWVLSRALEILDLLSELGRAELRDQLRLSPEEIAHWDDVSRRMFVPFHDGIISQFEGYEALEELDWEDYRVRYGNIQRLELILEAEHDSANRYKLSKQADTLMLFYLFSSEALGELFARLGYEFDPESIPRTVAYYDARSSHGSTLSRVVHAWVLARSDRNRAAQYFAEALQSDVNDIQEGSTAEGIHLGAMAGTVDLIQRAVTGIEATSDALRLSPRLPEGIERIDMRIVFRSNALDLRLTRDKLTVHGRNRKAPPIVLDVRGERCEFAGGQTREFHIVSGRPI